MEDLKIIRYPNKLLKQRCKPVEDPTALTTTIRRAWMILRHTPNAMAIAANQLGILQRWFIMRTTFKEELNFINPVWQPAKGPRSGAADLNEGCLSSPGISAIVPSRVNYIEVKAFNLDGNEFKVHYSGLDAVCVQHEIDHLNGKFWLDKLSVKDRARLRAKAVFG